MDTNYTWFFLFLSLLLPLPSFRMLVNPMKIIPPTLVQPTNNFSTYRMARCTAGHPNYLGGQGPRRLDRGGHKLDANAIGVVRAYYVSIMPTLSGKTPFPNAFSHQSIFGPSGQIERYRSGPGARSHGSCPPVISRAFLPPQGSRSPCNL